MQAVSHIEDLRTKAFQSGDISAYDFFFNAFFRDICYFIRSYNSKIIHPEDIAQDCFLKAWQYRERMRNTAFLKSFLYTSARNACIDEFRRAESRRSREIDFVRNDSMVTPSFEDVIIKTELLKDLYTKLADMPDTDQKVIQLYYTDGKTDAEIAQLLDTTTSAILNRRRRAVLQLRKRLLFF